MGQRTIQTHGVLTLIRVDPAPNGVGSDPRVWVEGQIQDTNGNVVEQVSEDLYPQLTAAQKTAVGNLIAKVTARLAVLAGD
jgi:hypothetical protein